MAFKAGNVGAELAALDVKYATQSGAGAVTGAYADVKQDGYGPYGSAVLIYNVANVTGTPDSFTATITVEDATASNGTGAAAYKPDGSNAVSVVLTAVGSGKISINTANARQYLAGKCTLAFVNGTSPAADVQLVLVGGGATTLPIPD